MKFAYPGQRPKFPSLAYFSHYFARLEASHPLLVTSFMFYLVFRNHCTLRLNIYLLKMSCGKRRKWHFWAPKYENVLGEHAPTPPCLQYLLRSNLSFPAYTFKTLSYAIEVSLSFSRSNVFWLLINREQELSAFCNSADLHCLLIFFFAGFPTESIISSFLQDTHFFPRRNTWCRELKKLEEL